MENKKEHYSTGLGPLEPFGPELENMGEFSPLPPVALLAKSG
jgi:hypothetical protein